MRSVRAISALFAVLLLGASLLRAQSGETAETTPPPPAGNPIVLDRVVAVINGNVILESDVKEEMRFAKLEPFSLARDLDTPKGAMRRIANRTLILQQMKEQNQFGVKISDEEVQKAITDLREHLPECRQYNCTTDEGWKAFLAAHDLTEAEVSAHWKQRLTILKFIDLRFRSGIRISSQEIDDYYKKSIVPVYQKENQKPPPLADISQRIQELLLQQHVNGLLQDWLKTLRHEGSVQILDPAYGESSGHTEEED
ncbi:MAG: SurA N-terminal domain-containing protein [Acidobacteriaceae bacterium]|nr:SurA N-terminal domain-containing protein [Acidobacteriaceae bacterium]